MKSGREARRLEPESRPESQPESRPESLDARVSELLVTVPGVEVEL